MGGAWLMAASGLAGAQGSLGLVLPALMGYGGAECGLLAAAYYAGSSLGAFTGGQLMDRHPPGPYLRGGLLVLGLATFAHALAPDFGTLCALRLLAGLAAGAIRGAPTLAARATRGWGERPGAALGQLLAAYTLGQTLGTPLALWLAGAAAHWAFAGLGGALCLAGALGGRSAEAPILVESDQRRVRRSGQTAPPPTAGLGGVVALHVLALAGAGWVWTFFPAWWGASGWPPEALAWTYLGAGLAQTAAAWLAGRFCDGWRPAAVSAVALAGAAAVAAGAGWGGGALAASLWLALVGTATAGRVPATHSLVLRLAPLAPGRAFGTLNVAGELARAVAGLAGGLLWEAGGFAAVAVAAAVAFALAALAALRLDRRTAG